MPRRRIRRPKRDLQPQSEADPQPDLEQPDTSASYLKRVVANTVENQADAISHPSLTRVQRQTMAAAIAQRRGNQHLQSVVNTLQRQPATVQRESPAYAADTIKDIESQLDTRWVGPLAEIKLFYLWESFKGDLPKVLSDPKNMALFAESHERGAELDDLPLSETLEARFYHDVKHKAFEYLDGNEAMAKEQMEQIGYSRRSANFLNDDHRQRLEELRNVATNIVALMNLQKELRKIRVGYSDPQPIYASGEVYYIESMPVTFDPSHPPDRPPQESDQNMLPWDMVAGVHAMAEGTINTFAAENPALFPLLTDPEKLDNITSEDNPFMAQQIIGLGLSDAVTNMERSRTAIATDDLDIRELKPIHEQLYRGRTPADSGTDWNHPYHKWVGQTAIGDYESTEFWKTLGLSSAAAVAFIVASVATFGTATFFMAAAAGAALTAYNVGSAWEKYGDLKSANKASLGQEGQLVDKQQVNAALISAILESGFALLDVAGLGVAARAATGARAGLKMAYRGLKEVGTMGAEEASPVMMKAITEFGVDEAVRRTGMSADELIQKFGADSDIGRILMKGVETDASSALPLLGDIAEGSLQVADDLVLSALRQHGAAKTIRMSGGWTKLTKTLGDNSAAAKELHQWRRSLYEELRTFTNDTLEGGKNAIIDTGTAKPTSDLDMSFLGAASTKNRQQAFEYMKVRVGVSSKQDLLHVLDMDMFTDPARGLLYMGLPTDIADQIAAKSAARERDLIFAERLHHARELAAKGGKEGAHGEKLVAQIESQMQTLGIKEVPYSPLSTVQVRAAAEKVDDLHAALEEAVTTGDVARQAQLADEIAQYSAMINAAEKGGYISGGAIERFVTNRKAFELMDAQQRAARGGVSYTMSQSAKYSSVIDQMLKLDHYAVELKMIGDMGATAQPAKIYDAVKGVSKYGERMADMSRDLLGETATTSGFGKSFEALRDAHTQLADLLAATGKDATDPLIKQIAEDTPGVMQRAIGALDTLDTAMNDLLMAMQRSSNVADGDILLQAMDALVRTQANYLLARKTLKQSLRVADRAAHFYAQSLGDYIDSQAEVSEEYDPERTYASFEPMTLEEAFNVAFLEGGEALMSRAHP